MASFQLSQWRLCAIQSLSLGVVCRMDQPCFFNFFLDSPVVPAAPMKSSSSSCSAGCGCPCPSLTHACTRKGLAERLQVPWLSPGPVQATSHLLRAGCPLCLPDDALPSEALLPQPPWVSTCPAQVGTHFTHSFCAYRLCWPHAGTSQSAGGQQGRAKLHSVQQQELTFVFLLLGRKTFSLLVLLPK